MSRLAAASAALLASTALAQAGGLDRTGLDIAALFQEGTYAEINLGYVMPEVVGNVGGQSSGDMAGSYPTYSLAYKQDLTDTLSVALIFEEAFGAAVEYTDADALYPVTAALTSGFEAQLSGTALSAILRYEINDSFSVHGGLRYVTMSGEIDFVDAGQVLTYDESGDLGYLIGVTYEIPDIALRASLTYNSATQHNNAISSSLAPIGPVPPIGPFATATGEYELPQSINLDFQTGIAEDTLLLASVRWAEWTETEIVTQSGLGTIDYDNDVFTYSLGAARRLTEDFALVGQVSYEQKNGGLASNLAPTDGLLGVSVAGVYTMGDMTITGGINYSHLGDATTETVLADFDGNHAVGFGLRVGYNF
jgi:long-subunit fatty acid transport protein